MAFARVIGSAFFCSIGWMDFHPNDLGVRSSAAIFKQVKIKPRKTN